jgi:hypothetical protein
MFFVCSIVLTTYSIGLALTDEGHRESSRQSTRKGHTAVEIGRAVWIECQVQPGPFSEELLVTIETIDGPVTGFIKSEELRRTVDDTKVRGIVRKIGTDYLEVWIKGSFFTTNGLANVPTELAMAA